MLVFLFVTVSAAIMTTVVLPISYSFNINGKRDKYSTLGNDTINENNKTCIDDNQKNK